MAARKKTRSRATKKKTATRRKPARKRPAARKATRKKAAKKKTAKRTTAKKKAARRKTARKKSAKRKAARKQAPKRKPGSRSASSTSPTASPEISVQKQPASLTNLEVCESFGTPIGDLPKQTDAPFYEEGNLTTGTWECEPGKLRLDLDVTEFCHLLKGHWILTSESGQVTELKAGDSWVFPRGWKGTSEVVETVRKVYMIVSDE